MNTLMESDAEVLDRLLHIRPGPYQVVSCYLQLRPWGREHRRYWTALKHRVRLVEADDAVARLPREHRLAVARDLGRVMSAVENLAGLPHTRGVAIFACEAVDLFVMIGLPRVRRTRLIVDDTPWLRELVATSGDFGRIAAVVLDRAHARLFQVTAAGAKELPCIPAVASRGGRYHCDRHGSPGWGERDYHHRIEHERYCHYTQVVEALERLVRTEPIRGIVVAGPLDSRTTFGRFLPRSLTVPLLGTARLDPNTVTEARVATAVADVAAGYERVAAERLADAFEEALGSGWAVDGPRATLRAPARGQLRTLVVRDDFAGSGYLCAGTRHLVSARDECRGEGAPTPVRDIADEAIEEALRQHVEVVTLPGDAIAESIDGIAGMLRFR